jgi:hypothetical protein
MTAASVPGQATPPAGVAGGTVAAGVLTSVVAALLVAASLGGRGALAAAIFPVQLMLIVGWIGVLGIRAGLGATGIAVGAAAVADVLVATGPADARRLMPVVAVGLLVALVHQLLRRDGRPGLTASLAGTVSAIALVCALATFVALRAGVGGSSAVLTALAAAAGAVLIAWLCDFGLTRPAIVGVEGRGWPGLLLGLAAACGIGALVGSARDELGVGYGVTIGVAVAAVALAAGVGVTLARTDAGTQPGRRSTVGLLPLAVVLPLAAAAPVAYVTGRILVG